MEPLDIRHFKSGTFRTYADHKILLPAPVNRSWTMSSPELNTLLSDADRILGELNAFSQLVPDVEFFIKMHVIKEATVSSKIEGTQTSLEEALLKKEDVTPEKRDDWQEVQNYIHAMNYSLSKLPKLPLSNRLLKGAHEILMRGVRGAHKQSGEFRKTQNWIGGATIKDAVFVPPPHFDVPDLMSDLEKFLNNHDWPMPELIRIAIAHYQFETIHPFADGNGRVGRLMITLHLVSKNILQRPTLYLSAFLEKNREFYYDNLTRVRNHNDLEQWIRFFLIGVNETGKASIKTFKDIIKLKERMDNELSSRFGKSKLLKSKLFLNELYKKPIATAADVEKKLDVSKPTANALIYDFQRMGILKELTGFKRNRVFSFRAYIALFNR